MQLVLRAWGKMLSLETGKILDSCHEQTKISVKVIMDGQETESIMMLLGECQQ